MFCMNCGTQLPDGAKFCFKCGKPMISSMQPASHPERDDNPNSEWDSLVKSTELWALKRKADRLHLKKLLPTEIREVGIGFLGSPQPTQGHKWTGGEALRKVFLFFQLIDSSGAPTAANGTAQIKFEYWDPWSAGWITSAKCDVSVDVRRNDFVHVIWRYRKFTNPPLCFVYPFPEPIKTFADGGGGRYGLEVRFTPINSSDEIYRSDGGAVYSSYEVDRIEAAP